MEQPLIHFDRVTKRYGHLLALDGLTFSAPVRGCLGLLGPNGAGKTTAIKSLLGIVRVDGGRIVDRSRKAAYLPQQPALFGWMTAEEFLRFVGSQAGVPEAALGLRVDHWLDRLLDDPKAKRRPIRGFSGGMKQRLGLAAVMLQEPDLVVLDEPVSALDPVGRRHVLQLIEELKQDRCVIMSTHILADAERVSDQVVIMAEGKSLLQQDVDTLRTQLSPLYEVVAEAGDEALRRIQDELEDAPWVDAVDRTGAFFRIVLNLGDDGVSTLLGFLASREGVRVTRLSRAALSLEDVFLQVVGKPK